MSRIIDFALQHVGKPYQLGARGPAMWDCSGLTKMAVKEIGLDWYHGATTQWRRGFQEGDPARYGYWADSGGIDSLPMNKLCFLFNKDKAKPGVMAHTGIYDGKGRVVQAGGRGGRGVHYNPLIRTAWSHWATVKGVDEEMSMGLMMGARGLEVQAMQAALIALGHDLGKWGADGKFGAQTEKAVTEFQEATGLPATGVWGQAEWDRLHEIQNAPPVDIPAPEPPKPVEIDREAVLDDLENYLTNALKKVRALKEAG